MMLRYIILAILLIIMLGVIRVAVTIPPKETSARIGERLPALTIPRFDAEGDLRIADIQGNGYALVHVFSSWCAPCKMEHPLLLALKDASGLPIYGISYRDNREELGKMLTKMGNPYTAIGWDGRGEFASLMGVSGVPEVFLIDPGGWIVYHYPGPLTAEVIQDNIIKYSNINK
ncbi:MAG: redoxin domain-containing protein [Hyphomicrobiales bacterium]|nr:redoxin domain-containing protein [Hyphomicrobiales bacterium]